MSGTVKGLNGWNYKIYSKKFTFDRPEILSLSYVESKINILEDILLRWAIVEANDRQLIVYATILSGED